VTDTALITPPPGVSTQEISRQRALARLKAFVTVIIWGASFVTTKIIVEQMDPLVLVPVRTSAGALLLFLLLRRRGQWAGFARGRLLGALAMLGFVGVALHLTIQAVGLSLTTASNTGWMVSLTPIFIALLAWRFLGERFGPRQTAGFAIAMSGALLIVIAQAGGLNIFGLPGTLGDGLAFSSAITWAVFSVLSKRVIGQRHPATLMVQVMVLGCLMTLPLFVARGGWNELALLDARGWLALAFTVLFVSSLAYLFWYDALSALNASQVGVFLYIEPLVTVSLAAMLLAEPLRPLALLGGAAILSGVWLVTQSGQH
jgi:drug/metabolite transporter (DMT)-like permease